MVSIQKCMFFWAGFGFLSVLRSFWHLRIDFATFRFRVMAIFVRGPVWRGKCLWGHRLPVTAQAFSARGLDNHDNDNDDEDDNVFNPGQLHSAVCALPHNTGLFIILITFMLMIMMMMIKMLTVIMMIKSSIINNIWRKNLLKVEGCLKDQVKRR